MQFIGCSMVAKVFLFKALVTVVFTTVKAVQFVRTLTCGAGSTSLLLFFVNSDTPLVCRMAEGRSDSFFFLIFCLSFFRSWSSFSLYTKSTGVIKNTPIQDTELPAAPQEEVWHDPAHFLSSPSRCCWRSRLKSGSKGLYCSMDVS